ncbi:inositol 2-dehydrogenase [Sphingomonas sp. TDK1]|uniref:inositol 2-dehydrogenase n=1 Tax=Sphingomonas sp. TDK1 TaxID=453247 RepID=UPI0007D9DCDF|nr:inositol 2-dehydrogenase [Sphingomonas sp. TDK1]OAN67074.1 inositol 2-dehydrogenase [Sphingomonas sp. TDK1]
MHAIALIGAGRIGRIHAANVAAHPGLRLKHIVDRDPTAASALAAIHGAISSPLEAVLTDPEVAGVIVASATPSHVHLTLAAADAGKAVLCEKPFGGVTAAARGAAVRLDRLGARVLIGFNRRFDSHFAGLHARLRAGEVGPLEALHLISHDPAPPPADYIAASGGLFLDMAIHDFDMARWLMGASPETVFATGSCLVDPAIGAAGDIDTARIVLRSADGRLCSISNSRRSGYGYDQRIEAYGAAGMLRVGNVAANGVERWDANGGHGATLQNFFLDRYADAYRAEIDQFAAVLDGAAPAITPHDAVVALTLAEAAARSARSGRVERL